MILFVVALAMMAASIIGKSLAVALVRHYEDALLQQHKKFVDVSTQLKVAQQKQVIAKKAEGVAAHKVATLKYRLSCLEDQIAQVELIEIKQELEKQREVGVVLDHVVRKALGQIGRDDEGRVQQVMGVITAMIDVEKQGNGDDLIAAIREKLTEMKEGHGAQAQMASPAEPPEPPLSSADEPPEPPPKGPVPVFI